MRAGECLEKQRVIKQGVAKYIEVWKSMMRRDALYAQEMSGYVAYQECLSSEITGVTKESRRPPGRFLADNRLAAGSYYQLAGLNEYLRDTGGDTGG
jgi:hypothetical protein